MKSKIVSYVASVIVFYIKKYNYNSDIVREITEEVGRILTAGTAIAEHPAAPAHEEEPAPAVIEEPAPVVETPVEETPTEVQPETPVTPEEPATPAVEETPVVETPAEPAPAVEAPLTLESVWAVVQEMKKSIDSIYSLIKV